MASKLLVVVDPSVPDQLATRRALISATENVDDVEVYLLVIVDQDSADTDADNPHVARPAGWLSDLVKPFGEAGISCSVELSWSSQFQKAIVKFAARVRPDLILVSARQGAKRASSQFSDAKWMLLRQAPCPVLLVRPNGRPGRQVVLASLRLQAEDADRYNALNDRILEHSKKICEIYGADLHVVNAYRSIDDHPDRSALLRLTGLANDRVHVELGPPAQAVKTVADRIDADVVVVGTHHRTGLAATMRGNTSEKVISAVSQDVLTIN